MIPKGILDLIPKYLFKTTNIGLLETILNLALEKNVDKAIKAAKYAKKFTLKSVQGLEILNTFLNNTGIFDGNSIISLDKAVALKKTIKKSQQKALQELEDGATVKEQLLYQIGYLNNFVKPLDFLNVKKLIDDSVAEKLTRQFDIDFKEDKDDGNTYPLNSLVFAYLIGGESEVRSVLRDNDIPITAFPSILKKVRSEASKNKDKYNEYLQPLENIRKERKIQQESRERQKVNINQLRNNLDKFGINKKSK